jgi:primosomal replication protein N
MEALYLSQMFQVQCFMPVASGSSWSHLRRNSHRRCLPIRRFGFARWTLSMPSWTASKHQTVCRPFFQHKHVSQTRSVGWISAARRTFLTAAQAAGSQAEGFATRHNWAVGSTLEIAGQLSENRHANLASMLTHFVTSITVGLGTRQRTIFW